MNSTNKFFVSLLSAIFILHMAFVSSVLAPTVARKALCLMNFNVDKSLFVEGVIYVFHYDKNSEKLNFVYSSSSGDVLSYLKYDVSCGEDSIHNLLYKDILLK